MFQFTNSQNPLQVTFHMITPISTRRPAMSLLKPPPRYRIAAVSELFLDVNISSSATPKLVDVRD